nr:hypothetical protein [Tanacetum cinerariifolium]
MLEIIKLLLWIASSTMISNTYKVEAQVADTQHQQPRSKFLCIATLKALKTWFQLYRLKSSLDMRNTLVRESITRRIIGVTHVEVDKRYNYGYLKKIAKKLSNLDQENQMDRRRSCVMIKAIDELMFKKRLKGNLKRFVAGEEYGNDLRLIERRILIYAHPKQSVLLFDEQDWSSPGHQSIRFPYYWRSTRPDMSFAGLDNSGFKSLMSEAVTSVHETKASASMTSKESMEKPKIIRSIATIIEE